MRRRLIVIAVSLLLLAAGAVQAFAEPSKAVLEAESQRIAAMRKAKDAVLAIFVPSGQGGGSGVVISPDGYALTNFHVAQPCGKYMQCGMADGKAYDAVLVGLDPTGDVALIKLFGRDDFPTAELGDSDRLRVGDWVFAMGNPFLLANDFQPTTTYGIVSGVHRYQPPSGTLLEYADCIQTDAPVNPGNSGGPLFDDQGRLVGINGRCSFEKRGRVNVGVAYAISINQLKNFLGVLHSGRVVDHATLGATVDRDAEGRVVVNDILESSDAYRRGLRYDDEIIAFAGRPIASSNALKNMLGVFPKGWRVPLSYRHEGKRHDVLVRLAGVHAQEELLQKSGGTEPPKPKEDPKRKPAAKPKGKGKAGRTEPQETAAPEIVVKNFQAKHGYANYRFNTLNQRRVWDAWQATAKLAEAGGAWTLAGSLGTGGKFRFLLDEQGGALKVPSGEIKWTAGDELGASLLPAHSGGLLPALYLWRRLATTGLGRFGDVSYYGTAPLPGRAALADVLVGSHKGVECWFYFDPADGRMLALEMFADEGADPCEVYFSEYREVNGRAAPGRMEVRCGDETFATFKIEEFKAEKPEGRGK
ncbi:MAG: trypsin-like peptidase domain-containing protein [Planctomycetaceae bacterium]|nr:trypsin-like peptidase domain-containing protein [Planctomycetaceae bacterium]